MNWIKCERKKARVCKKARMVVRGRGANESHANIYLQLEGDMHRVGSMGITKICSFSGVKKAFVLCFTLKHVNNPTEIPSLMRKNEPGSTLNHTYEVCKSPVTLCL